MLGGNPAVTTCYPFTSVQLSTTDPGDYFLNGYMVAPREDTGTPLDGNVSYVGSWENGTDLKLLCNKVSTCMHMYVCMYVYPLQPNVCNDYMWRQGWWKLRK